MIKKIYLLFVLILYSITVNGNENNYFRRHIHIVVDQTPDILRRDNGDMYDFILNALSHDENSSWYFDPSKDEISLYVFGIDGSIASGGTYRKIWLCNYTSDVETQYNRFMDSFIQFRGNYSSCQDVEVFFNDYVSCLLDGSDLLAKNIQENSGITLSKYVYPAIIRHISQHQTKPSVENIIVLVTNYQSGVNDMGTSEDVKRLKECVGEQNYDYFETQFDLLEAPYYQIPIDKKVFKGKSNWKLAQPVVDVKKIALRSLQGVSVYVSSNVVMNQKAYDGREFTIDDVVVAFYRDDNLLAVDSIFLNIGSKEDKLFSSKIDTMGLYSPQRRSYLFPSRDVELGRMCNEGDTIDIEYVFHARVLSGSETLLPLVFKADRGFVFDRENIVSLLEDRKNMMLVVLAIVAVFAVIACILYRVRENRGRQREVSLTFDIRPVSNERFMKVENQKVTSLDCWYLSNQSTETNINIYGCLNVADLSFAKSYGYCVEAKIQDIDGNDNFTFKPDPRDGRTVMSDGSRCGLNEWFVVSRNPGDFQFNAVAYISNIDYRLDPTQNDILTLKVELRVVRMKNNVADNNKEQLFVVDKDYTFIVKPRMENSNLWVAFDPGTSGSCIAYGIAGSPTDNDDIFVAENTSETLTGTSYSSSVFPSKIKINSNSTRLFSDESFNAENLIEGRDQDFIFGNDALIRWNDNGVNCFQSIKKLLGYKTPLKIKGKNHSGGTNIKEISGQDVAHLLVKGLCNHFEEYLLTNSSVTNDIRNAFVDQFGSMKARRAIVAVPNSYTLAKIQDMVDSVDRTKRFNEVHFIYESEAVFMMYLRKNWRNLSSKQDKVFVVYDMGGATINITAFNINVHTIDNNISKIEVSTLAKIGYVVGGDDIDYALIQMLYDIPTVKVSCDNHYEHQRRYKEKLLSYVRGLKLEIIDKINGVNSDNSKIKDVETFYGSVKALFDNDLELSIPEINDNVINYLRGQDKRCENMEKYVHSKVRDAMEELLLMLNKKGSELEIIFSGRSTLYPKIKSEVFSQIRESGYACSNKEWDGFNVDGKVDNELVKTAVATGACWYAMYSTRINLHHDILTSSFGYIDTIDNRQVFVPLLKAGTGLNVVQDKLLLKSDNVKPNDSLISDVKIVQMLGSDYDKVWGEKIHHKYNLISEVRPNLITNQVEHISINVDNCDNYDFAITLVTGDVITRADVQNKDLLMEIAYENSPAYIYATSNILDIDTTVEDDWDQKGVVDNKILGGGKKRKF